MDCIEVRRSDSGCYEIPGAGLPERWSEVRAAMVEVESYGGLVGWGEWAECWRALDRDGLERWYFVSTISPQRTEKRARKRLKTTKRKEG